MTNPCEKHLNVKAKDFCPVCLYDEVDKLQRENLALKLLKIKSEGTVLDLLSEIGNLKKELRQARPEDEPNPNAILATG